MPKESKKLRQDLLQLLSQYLGVDTTDIQEDDDLSENLNLGLSGLYEFTQFLQSKGYETSEINLEELTTVNDLLDSLSDNN